MTASGSFPFTSTHGVIYRIHGNSPHLGTASKPALSTCLSERYVLMIHIPDLTHRRSTQNVNPPHFPGRESHLSIISFFGH